MSSTRIPLLPRDFLEFVDSCLDLFVRNLEYFILVTLVVVFLIVVCFSFMFSKYCLLFTVRIRRRHVQPIPFLDEIVVTFIFYHLWNEHSLLR